MLKVFSTFFKKNIHPFHRISWNFSESLLDTAGNSLFIVTFKIFHDSYVFTANFFQEIPTEISRAT